jgi:hypothetical protein
MKYLAKVINLWLTSIGVMLTFIISIHAQKTESQIRSMQLSLRTKKT